MTKCAMITGIQSDVMITGIQSDYDKQVYVPHLQSIMGVSTVYLQCP